MNCSDGKLPIFLGFGSILFRNESESQSEWIRPLRKRTSPASRKEPAQTSTGNMCSLSTFVLRYLILFLKLRKVELITENLEVGSKRAVKLLHWTIVPDLRKCYKSSVLRRMFIVRRLTHRLTFHWYISKLWTTVQNQPSKVRPPPSRVAGRGGIGCFKRAPS